MQAKTLTEKEAAVYTGMSRSFLAQSRMDRTLADRAPGPPFLRVGRSITYLLSDLDRWLIQHRVEV